MIYQYIINNENQFMKTFEETKSVTNFAIRETKGQGLGTKFYINDSPYPIIICQKDGVWATNFYGEIDIEKIRICSTDSNNDDREFQINIETTR